MPRKQKNAEKRGRGITTFPGERLRAVPTGQAPGSLLTPSAPRRSQSAPEQLATQDPEKFSPPPSSRPHPRGQPCLPHPALPPGRAALPPPRGATGGRPPAGSAKLAVGQARGAGAVRGRRPLAGRRHVASPAAILGHYLPRARSPWLREGISGRVERRSSAGSGGPAGLQPGPGLRAPVGGPAP